MEAIVLSKFIISSNCATGPKEILNNGKGGELFEVGNYKDLARKIIFCSNNKKICKEKIKFALSRVNRFDYEINLNEYFEVLQKYS